jgi:hypothetical protein
MGFIASLHGLHADGSIAPGAAATPVPHTVAFGYLVPLVGRSSRIVLDAWGQRSTAERVRAVVFLAIAAAAVIEALRHSWITDDIFITFRYCDNMLAGHGPVYNTGERSEGYTHFLWFVLLTLGRTLGVSADWLGKYAALPAFVGCLVWLVRLSRRLWPDRGGLWGVPVAMLAWALHEDARRFASGGLETAAFTWALLIGVEALLQPDAARRGRMAAWAFAVATLLRPEGLLYSAVAGVWLLWSGRGERRDGYRAARDFALVWILLVAPLFVFRKLYYGWWLPNPFYAKSGGGAYWGYGWTYTRVYFTTYVLLLTSPLAAFAIRAGLRAGASPDDQRRARILVYLAVAAALTILYVTRVGGDFMFARFFLPVTPFLLLLVEAGVQHLSRPRWRLAAAAACSLLMVYGVVRKHATFGNGKHVGGIGDEPQFYPQDRQEYIEKSGLTLRECFANTGAVVMVQGGQAALAYYAQYPVAIERFGLTDETIAHQPLVRRGRPGHEKVPTAEYLYERKVNLRVSFQLPRNAPQYSQFQLGTMYGDIIVYDRALMDRLKSCPNARFFDFPIWLTSTYIPSINPALRVQHIADWNQFQHFYFNHNPDPERLRERLRAALAAAGIGPLPDRAPPVLVLDPSRGRG